MIHSKRTSASALIHQEGLARETTTSVLHGSTIRCGGRRHGIAPVEVVCHSQCVEANQ